MRRPRTAFLKPAFTNEPSIGSGNVSFPPRTDIQAEGLSSTQGDLRPLRQTVLSRVQLSPPRRLSATHPTDATNVNTRVGGRLARSQPAVHRSAAIKSGAVLKSAVIIGPNCFVAAGAYLRGGVYLDENCIIGPGSELKTSFMFKGSKLAHLNFVGDSILGADVNIEAGAIIANYRNECDDKSIRFSRGESVIETGIDKFGALVGDGSRIGANAVVAPGAILDPATKIPRLTLLDQRPSF